MSSAPGDAPRRVLRPARRLRTVGFATLAVLLLEGFLVAGAGAATAAPAACDTKSIDRGAALGSYQVEICLLTPARDATLADPVDVTATAKVHDPTNRAVVRRVRFRWLPAGAPSDTYLLSDNDAEPGNLYRMSLRSYRLPGTSGTLVARAIVDGDATDAVEEAKTADTAVAVTKDTTTVPPVSPPFSPRSGTPGPGKPYTLAAVGDGVDGSPQSHAVVKVIKGWSPDSFSYLGDVATNGSAYEFDTWYGETGGFGDLRAITNPVIGNHEYRTDSGDPYFRFWGGVPHYYSYDVGGWHVVVLDSTTEFAQTAAGSEQYTWLDADLTAHRDACTIVMQHQPRYAEAPGSRGYLQDLWSLAYDRGVTLLLAGHVHRYERWQPMDAAGNVVPDGLTQIVAGGGGSEAVNEATPDARVAHRKAGVGALRLDLGGRELGFTYADGAGAVVDAGTVPCRQSGAAPTATPSGTSTPSSSPSGTATPTPTPSDTATTTTSPSDTATPTTSPSDTATPRPTLSETGSPSSPAVSTTPPVTTAAPTSGPTQTAPVGAPPDTTPPTAPTGLTAAVTSTTSAVLTWQPSIDAIGVASYVVRRNDTVVATLPGGATSWGDGGLSPGRTYRWTVEAIDAAGNRSSLSAPASVKIPKTLRSTKALLADLRTAAEHRSGWTVTRFRGWTDTDADACRTPEEVFVAEAVMAPRMRVGCDLQGGRWRSAYDGRIRSSVDGLVVDHTVGLREAWESGAYRWSLTTRRRHANDLDYAGTLIAVTKVSAGAKADREPQDWLPRKAHRCAYVSQWVAVKWRWGLAVDRVERTFLASKLSSCGWPTVRVPTRRTSS